MPLRRIRIILDLEIRQTIFRERGKGDADKNRST
jgi:hypothetical protein